MHLLKSQNKKKRCHHYPKTVTKPLQSTSLALILRASTGRTQEGGGGEG